MGKGKQYKPYEEPRYFDGFDNMIHDIPYEPTGEQAYREKIKYTKRREKTDSQEKMEENERYFDI